MNAQKTVHVLPANRNAGYAQGLYLDATTGTLVPNLVFVDESGDVLFETNSLGLRGPEPAPDQRFGVVWGCSVVFSIVGRGWPELITDASVDCLFLDGGVEGSPYPHILKRALDTNRVRPAALNLLMLGWRPFLDNRHVHDDLTDVISEIPNPVLLTQPTCLNA